jgi:hypothetical protein
MLPLDSPAWAGLEHAYGPAAELPALLQRAASDLRPGHVKGSAWFSLWSCLCHQGDVYPASYAAAPHLAAIASARRGSETQFDPLHLVACIELSRLEGTGPEIPDILAGPYRAAIAAALGLATEALEHPWSAACTEALRGCIAALSGRAAEARAILDADGDDDGIDGDR